MGSRRTHEVSIDGTPSGFSLVDLRWLIRQTEALGDDARVRLHYDAGFNQFDPGSSSLSVSFEEE